MQASTIMAGTLKSITGKNFGKSILGKISTIKSVMGPTATTVFQKLASMLAEKWNMNYSRCSDSYSA